MNMPLNFDVRLNFIRVRTSFTEKTIIIKINMEIQRKIINSNNVITLLIFLIINTFFSPFHFYALSPPRNDTCTFSNLWPIFNCWYIQIYVCVCICILKYINIIFSVCLTYMCMVSGLISCSLDTSWGALPWGRTLLLLSAFSFCPFFF